MSDEGPTCPHNIPWAELCWQCGRPSRIDPAPPAEPSPSELAVKLANISRQHPTYIHPDRIAEAFDAAGLAALLAERDALAKFKAYVHKRLDDAGIPVDPESPHKAQGCRIGGRLDVVLGKLNEYKVLWRQYQDAADQVFQVCTEIMNPILPDFLLCGESKSGGVVKLAKAYKGLVAERDRLCGERNQLLGIVADVSNSIYWIGNPGWQERIKILQDRAKAAILAAGKDVLRG